MKQHRMRIRVTTLFLIWILVCAAFVGMISVFNEFVGEAHGITVPVDYPTIQDAINNSMDGDTIYVWAGTYNENLIVNKTITLIGNGTGNTTINGGVAGNAVFIESDWVNLTGFNISGIGGYGIQLSNVFNCHIYDNEIYSPVNFGVYVNSGSDNNISDNTIQSNGGIDAQGAYTEIYNNDINTMGLSWALGIRVWMMPDTIIAGNNITNAYRGIFDFQGPSANTMIINNNISNCGWGVYFQASGAYAYATVSDNDIFNNNWGIYCEASHANQFTNNNIISNAEYGIYLTGSTDGEISNNNCSNNGAAGIFVRGTGNMVTGNNVSSNVGVAPPPFGPAGYWKLNNGTGQIAYDSSGNGNDGILGSDTGGTNDPTWADCQFEGGLEFDGSATWVEVPTDPSLNITTEITLEAWIKVYGDTGDHQTLVSKWFDNGVSAQAYVLETTSNGQGLRINLGGVVMREAPNIYNFNEWFHGAITYNGSMITFYLNGEMLGAQPGSGSISSTTAPLFIGAHDSAVDRNPFNGSIDELRIYDRTLSHEEIMNQYMGGIHLKDSGGNVVYMNDMYNNSFVGLSVSNSENNQIYHNNYLSNRWEKQALDISAGTNQWDIGLPWGGNYWDDWTTPDLDDDGFVDNPYILEGNVSAQDNWPWASKSGWLRVENLDTGQKHFNIQDAIDNASAGHTLFAKKGLYLENVVVDKTLTLIGEDKEKTIIDGSGSGDVMHVTADWVNITGFNITNGGSVGYDSGIKLSNVENCDISDTNIYSNSNLGIYLTSASNNDILDNNIINNTYGLILDSSSDYNTITNNDVQESFHGIYLDSSSNNTITNNNASSSTQMGIVVYSSSNFNDIIDNNISDNGFHGIYVHTNSNNNTISDNRINLSGMMAVILQSSTGNTVSNNDIIDNIEHGVYVFSSSSFNTISDNEILDNSFGILFENSDDNEISSNNISDNGFGIVFRSSSLNDILDNNITFNDWHGIRFETQSNNSTISGNDVSSNSNYGMFIESSEHTTISDNDIFSNTKDGIWLNFCNYSTISNNNISLNDKNGIHLDSSHNNNITDNTCPNNIEAGIYLSLSNNNSIIDNFAGFDEKAFVQSDLVGYWKFDEGSGSVAYDDTDNDNDGTITGSTWTGGIYGNALDFNGVDDYVNAPGTWGGPGWTEITVEAWIKVDGDTGDFQAILSSTGSDFVHLQLHSAGNIGIYTDAGMVTLPIIDTTPHDTWRHIVLTAKSGDTRVYENGSQVGPTDTTAFSYILQATSVRIGSGFSNDRFFNGTIDEVMIYDRALSKDEIYLRYSISSHKSKYGINLDFADNNNISDNRVISNNYGGTWLNSCNNNTISGNNCSDNGGSGIYLAYGTGNSIVDNHIYSNSGDYMPSGLIGYWKMDEESGDTVYDDTLSSNNGAIIGDQNWVSGMFGNGLYLDGDDFVSLDPSGMPTSSSTPFSISLWFKPDADEISGTLVYWGDNPVTNGIVTLDYSDGSVGWTLNFDFYANALFVDIGSLNGQWNYVVATYNGFNRKIYLDGELIAIDTTSALNIPLLDDFQFGLREQYFKGIIDEVRIFHRALSEDEIRNQYNLLNNEIKSFSAYGILLRDSNSNEISGNDIISNTNDGIHLTSSSDNTISNNNCSNNINSGIRIEYGSGNAITNNYVNSNGDPMPSGLVSYWNLDEGTGQIAADSSGNGNDGQLGSSPGVDGSDPTWVDGKFGGALKFDGVNDYVEFPVLMPINYDTNFSISAWVYIEDISFEKYIIIMGDKWGPSHFMTAIRTLGGAIYFGCAEEGVIWEWTPGFNIDVNTWYYVAGVYENTEMNLYMNGVLYYSEPFGRTTLTSSTVPGHIGRYSTVNGFFFNGIIDEVRIFNRALSEEEVRGQYASGIYMEESCGNSISGNNINKNALGVYMISSNNNSVLNNNISTNAWGIFIQSSDDNTIYHNNIIDNTNQAFDNTSTNSWNLPYPGGGNYWGDYIGSDYLSGTDQNILGSDGFGDTPYEISGGAGAKDYYPLTRPTEAPEGDILITSHSDGEYVSGAILIEATSTFADTKGINYYVNGTLMFTDYSYPYQFILDTTSLPEDEVFTLTAEAVLFYGFPIHTSITLFVNNYVDTGSYITVTTLQTEYQPDDDVQVIVTMTSPPSFDALDLIVNYKDPSGNPLYVSEDGLPFDSKYMIIMPLSSDTELGTYTVTADAYGYVNGTLIWQATNSTTFTVSGKSLREELEDLNETLTGMNDTINDIQNRVMDIQNDLDSMNLTLEELQDAVEYLNQTLPVQFDNLSANLLDVNDSLIDRIFELENTILGNLTEFNDTNIMDYLQGMNASLYSQIQSLLTSITDDIVGMNDSLSDQLTDLLDNMTTDNDALRNWLEIVLDQIDTNLTATKNTLQQQLDDLNTTMQTYHNEILADLVDVHDSLSQMETNLSLQHTAISDSIDTLNNTVAGAPGLSTGDILDRINDSIALLEDVDSNVTTHSSDIQNLRDQLTGLMENQGNMTRDQLIQNVSEIIGEMQSLDAEIVAHDDDVMENLTTLQDLIDNIGTRDISGIMSALDEMEGNLSSLDTTLASDIGEVKSTVETFQQDVEGRLEEINTTLRDMEKLEDILGDLSALNQTLEQGNDELKAEIEEIPTDKKKEEEGFGLTQILLLIVLVLLVINLLVALMRSGGKAEGKEAIPEEEVEPESKGLEEVSEEEPEEEWEEAEEETEKEFEEEPEEEWGEAEEEPEEEAEDEWEEEE